MRDRYNLPDCNKFPRTWTVLRRWLGEVRPATTMMVAGLVEKTMRTEIEVTLRKSSSTNSGEGHHLGQDGGP